MPKVVAGVEQDLMDSRAERAMGRLPVHGCPEDHDSLNCAITGRTIPFGQARSLYGQPVLRTVQARFASRRQIAFAIDIALINLLIITSEAVGATGPALVTVYAISLTLLWIKDGVNGQSFGKRLMGIQVIDGTSGSPAGMIASCKRNLFLFVPIYPLIVAQLLLKGHRPGDGWARTKVILCRQRKLDPFLPHRPSTAQSDAQQRATDTPNDATRHTERSSFATNATEVGAGTAIAPVPVYGLGLWCRNWRAPLAIVGFVLVLTVGLFVFKSEVAPAKAAATPSPATSRTLADIIAEVRPSIVTVISLDQFDRPIAQGSGFIIDSMRVVTNEHVVRGAISYQIKLSSGTTVHHTILKGTDPERDLAVLECLSALTHIRPLPLAADRPREGDEIVVVGSPLGLEQTASNGIVSAWRNLGPRGTVMQITAPISSGSSGSPVLNWAGEVVGVVRSKIVGGENINIAVAVQELAPVLADLENSSVVARNVTSPEQDEVWDEIAGLILDAEEKYEKWLAERTKAVAAYFGNRWESASALERSIMVLDTDGLVDLLDGSTDSAWGSREKVALPFAEIAAEEDPENASAWHVLGRCLLGIQKYDEALAALDAAIRLDPEIAQLHLDRATALYYRSMMLRLRHQSDTTLQDDSINAARRAIQLDPELRDAHTFLGARYAESGQTLSAIRSYEKATIIGPEKEAPLHSLAEQYLIVGRHPDAVAIGRRVLVNWPESYQAFYVIGVGLGAQGNWSEAIEMFRQGAKTEADGLFQSNHLALIEALLHVGRSREAGVEVERLLDEEVGREYATESSIRAHYYAGLLRLSQGRVDEAAAHYREMEAIIIEIGLYGELTLLEDLRLRLSRAR